MRSAWARLLKHTCTPLLGSLLAHVLGRVWRVMSVMDCRGYAARGVQVVLDRGNISWLSAHMHLLLRVTVAALPEVAVLRL